MKNILTPTLLTILLFHSYSSIFSMKNNSSYSHKILTKAFVNNEDPIYSKEQLRKNIELFKFALGTYEPIYTNDEYKEQVKDFYSSAQYLYEQELIYLKKIYQNIKSTLQTQNYSELPNIYSITFNPNYPLTDYFGHDYNHKKHAVKVRSLMNLAVRNKIGHLLKTEISSEYNQVFLENIDDGFLLAATLIEGSNWINSCIDFLNKIFNS